MNNKKERGFLSQIWRGVVNGAKVASICYAAAIAGHSYNVMSNESRYEPLTEGEKKLLTGIFGDQLNVDVIRIHRNAPEGGKPGNVMAYVYPFFGVPLRSNHIYFVPEYSQPDYSDPRWTENPPYNYGAFVHEAAHVWQNQSGNMLPASAFCKPEHADNAYYYDLIPGKKFTDYCVEQQAEMVRDYTLYYLYTYSIRPYDKKMSGSMDLLRDTVEAQFPEAKKTREDLERQRGQGPAKQTLPAPSV